MLRRIFGYVLVVVGILVFITVMSHFQKPFADVVDYNNTPENYKNSLGLKVINPEDLPPEKYKKIYRFVWVVEDAIGFESSDYLAAFPKDAVKKLETKNDSRIVIFSDYRPSFYDYRRTVNLNGSIYMDLLKRAAKECSLRAKWLRE